MNDASSSTRRMGRLLLLLATLASVLALTIWYIGLEDDGVDSVADSPPSSVATDTPLPASDEESLPAPALVDAREPVARPLRAPDVPDPARITVHGRIVDADGAPIENARVVMQRAEDLDRSWRDLPHVFTGPTPGRSLPPMTSPAVPSTPAPPRW